MRTIKFRGLSKFDNHDWLYGSLLILNNKYYICPSVAHSWNMAQYEVIPETIGQLTELRDREGNEVYEGDILTVAQYWNVGMDLTDEERTILGMSYLRGELKEKFTVPVFFEDGAFYLMYRPSCWYCLGAFLGNPIHSQPIYDIAIVGNIHENPNCIQYAETDETNQNSGAQ